MKDIKDYEWSSFPEYIGKKNGICSKQEVLGFFKNSKEYHQFVTDQEDYALRLVQIKHQLLDLEA